MNEHKPEVGLNNDEFCGLSGSGDASKQRGRSGDFDKGGTDHIVVAQSSYSATIRTPMDTKDPDGMPMNTDQLSKGVNQSLTGLETSGADGMSGHSKVDRLKERAVDLKDNLISRASDIGHSVGDSMTSARTRMSGSMHNMTDRVKSTDYDAMAEPMRRPLRRDPNTSMIVAAGIGLALGFFMGRRD